MTAWLLLEPLKLDCLPEEKARVYFPRMCWSEDHKALQRSTWGLHHMALNLSTPTGASLPQPWFAWWSWAVSSSPHSFCFFMKKKGQANTFQGPFQPQNYMVRADLWRGWELFIWGKQLSVVNFPKAGDKWEIRLWRLDIPFFLNKAGCKGLWVQVTFRKVPGVLRGRGGGICFSNMNNDPFN